MKYLDCFLRYGIIIAVTSLKLTSSQCNVTETPPLKNPAYATERLLTMTTSSARDAKTLAELVFSKLECTGLKTYKILAQVYDGAPVMSGNKGGVQRLLQEKEKREIPYIHCFNHQLHLVVVHSISAEKEVSDFF